MINGNFALLNGKLFYVIEGPGIYKRFKVTYSSKEEKYARAAALFAASMNMEEAMEREAAKHEVKS